MTAVLFVDKNLNLISFNGLAKEYFNINEGTRSVLPIFTIFSTQGEEILSLPSSEREVVLTYKGVSINASILPLGDKASDGGGVITANIGSSEGKDNSEKLISLGTFAGSIAHDLNNLLMAVLGHLSYLMLTTDESLSDSLKAAEEGAKKASQLSKQILDFARVDIDESPTSSLIDVCEITRGSIPLLSPSLPDGISISLKCPDSPLIVQAKDSQITQILLNLIVNARDAMPKGGKISIEIGTIELNSPGVLHGFSLDRGKYARIIVSDTGEGITEEVKARMFEPFFTTKKGTGTGLGLATVFFLVKSLRGAIDVKSSEGRGTSFSVAIPLSTDSISSHVSEKKATKYCPTETALKKERCILVVDDEDPVRMVLEKSLELLGASILVAENGIRALEIFKEHGQLVDLVVMDMIMPGMAGDELFYELKKINKDVKVLISSGYASDQKTRQLIKDGAIGLIQKPFSVEELLDKVKEIII